ncbi:angiotensinogen [Platysternon megacephalum]|uniref:Angiotensinogen n=1 Tax=Platysternon megacephalum TaxID=55544 RepID=A0A4D9DQK7_9SAUR|nr:angiotensinogen [Platysternon megacephalum]
MDPRCAFLSDLQEIKADPPQSFCSHPPHASPGLDSACFLGKAPANPACQAQLLGCFPRVECVQPLSSRAACLCAEPPSPHRAGFHTFSPQGSCTVGPQSRRRPGTEWCSAVAMAVCPDCSPAV